MKESFNQVKSNIILIIMFMALLFTICIVMYTDIFTRNIEMDINTNMGIKGGNDALSQELQNMIPYIKTTDIKYVTAYQNKKTNISSIHNDVILTKAFSTLEEKDLYDSGEFLKKINKFYGTKVFIVNESFMVNGKNLCIYKNNKYSCSSTNYNGIIYEAKRSIENLSIDDDNIYLYENILFFSTETINNITYYKIYKDGTYTELTDAFTNLDIEKDNTNLNTYLKKYNDKKIEYKSTFIVTNEGYNWLSTEVL